MRNSLGTERLSIGSCSGLGGLGGVRLLVGSPHDGGGLIDSNACRCRFASGGRTAMYGHCGCPEPIVGEPVVENGPCRRCEWAMTV